MQILEYVEDKDKIRLCDLIGWLDDKGKTIYGKQKVAGNLTALGWRRENRGEDIYLKLERCKEVIM